MAKITTTRIPDDLREALGSYARNIGITRNALIIQILHSWAEGKKLLKEG